MRLYSGSTPQLFEDTARNQIAGKLVGAFVDHFGHKPSDSEVASWQNSLRALTLAFQRSKLDDHGVLIEYKLPLTSKRLDCLICGHDEPRRPQAVILELKQWEWCDESDGDNLMQYRSGTTLSVGQAAQARSPVTEFQRTKDRD